MMNKIKIALIAHPIDLRSFSIISGYPLRALRLVGKNNVKTFLSFRRPFIFSRVQNFCSPLTNSCIDIVGIACPLLPEQMVGMKQDTVMDRIIDSVRLAEKDGAQLAVLGGFTSVIGNEGEEVSKSVSIKVTSGNTYTAALAIYGIIEAANLIGVDLSRAKCSVIGATGDIGSACVRFFARKTESISIVARNQEKLETLANEITSKSKCNIGIYKKTKDAVVDSDIVITATSALTTVIESNMLKRGAIVCDVALPANIAREISRIRKDVFVFEGGLAKCQSQKRINGSKIGSLMPTNATFGCFAEGLILGLEGRIENFSIGRGNISTNSIDLIWRLSNKQGFGLSDFFCGDKFYSQDDINLMKPHANQKERSYARNYI